LEETCDVGDDGRHDVVVSVKQNRSLIELKLLTKRLAIRRCCRVTRACCEHVLDAHDFFAIIVRPEKGLVGSQVNQATIEHEVSVDAIEFEV